MTTPTSATILTLPWDRPPSTSNDARRQNRWQNAASTRTVRTAVAWIAKANNVPTYTYVDVLATWHIPDARTRDAGALYPMLKAALDGLVDAGVLPGDSFKHVRTESCRIVLDRAEPRITLAIEAVPTPKGIAHA